VCARDRSFRRLEFAHLIKRDAARDPGRFNQALKPFEFKVGFAPAERRLLAQKPQSDQPIERARFVGRDLKHARHVLRLLRDHE